MASSAPLPLARPRTLAVVCGCLALAALTFLLVSLPARTGGLLNHDLPRDILFTAALFGVVAFVWAGMGHDRPPSWRWRIPLVVVQLAGLALAGVTIPDLVRGWRTLPSALGSDTGTWVGYYVTFGVEIVLAAAAGIVLYRTGRKVYFFPVLLAIVGAHFVPLGAILEQPVYHLTAALILAVAGAAVLLRDRAAPSFWCGIVGGPVFLLVGAYCAMAALGS